MEWAGGFVANGSVVGQGWIESDLGYGSPQWGIPGIALLAPKPVATCYASGIKTIGPRIPQAIVEKATAGALEKVELIDGGFGYSDFPLAYVYNGTSNIDFNCNIYTYGSKIGSIKDVKVKNHGTGYANNEIIFPTKAPPASNSGEGYPNSTATGTLITSSTYRTETQTIDNIGLADGTQRLQDGALYNDFSYMLESPIKTTP